MKDCKQCGTFDMVIRCFERDTERFGEEFVYKSDIDGYKFANIRDCCYCENNKNKTR